MNSIFLKIRTIHSFKVSAFSSSNTTIYCFIAIMNISFERKIGPAFRRIERSRCNDSIFERSSCDLGSSVPSGRGFIDNLQRSRNTRKAPYWRMCVNFAAAMFSFSESVFMMSWDGASSLIIVPILGTFFSSSISFSSALFSRLSTMFTSFSRIESTNWLTIPQYSHGVFETSSVLLSFPLITDADCDVVADKGTTVVS